MKCWTKLKSRTKARRRRNFFYRLYRNRTHKINEILNEIEKQNRRKLTAGEKFFYRLCRNRTHTINEILNEIEKQDDESSPQAKKNFTLFWFSELWTPVGGILIFRTGGVAKFTGCDLPRRGMWKYPWRAWNALRVCENYARYTRVTRVIQDRKSTRLNSSH